MPYYWKYIEYVPDRHSSLLNAYIRIPKYNIMYLDAKPCHLFSIHKCTSFASNHTYMLRYKHTWIVYLVGWMDKLWLGKSLKQYCCRSCSHVCVSIAIFECVNVMNATAECEYQHKYLWLYPPHCIIYGDHQESMCVISWHQGAGSVLE